MINRFEILKEALNAEYRHMMPEGFSIYRIAEYDPEYHKAPHLSQKEEVEVTRYAVEGSTDMELPPALALEFAKPSSNPPRCDGESRQQYRARMRAQEKARRRG